MKSGIYLPYRLVCATPYSNPNHHSEHPTVGETDRLGCSRNLALADDQIIPPH